MDFKLEKQKENKKDDFGKMKNKEFSNFSKRKIIYAIILVIIIFFLQFLISIIFPIYDAPWRVGIPFTFLNVGCGGLPPLGQEQQCVNDFYLYLFIIDLIFWFVFSYIIISLYKKLKTR